MLLVIMVMQVAMMMRETTMVMVAIMMISTRAAVEAVKLKRMTNSGEIKIF